MKNLYRQRNWIRFLCVWLILFLISSNILSYNISFTDWNNLTEEDKATIVKAIRQAMKYAKIVEGKTSIVVTSIEKDSELTNKIIYNIKFYLLVEDDKHRFLIKVPIHIKHDFSTLIIISSSIASFIVGYLLGNG